MERDALSETASAIRQSLPFQEEKPLQQVRNQSMSNLPLVFMAGLLGSSHCVGMCGGFALSIGAVGGRWSSILVRQVVYSAGRLMTYGFCGALAGAFGRRVSQVPSNWFNLQAFVAIVAGLLLIWQGLQSSGILRFPQKSPAHAGGSCPAGTLFKTFLTAPHLTGVFIAGLTTGFLPCGLVYAHLALAGASGGMGSGLMTMVAFGAGTVPLMVMTGLGGRMLSFSSRRRLLKCAAWCVIVTGVISTTRGALAAASAFQSGTAEQTTCPFCLPKS